MGIKWDSRGVFSPWATQARMGFVPRDATFGLIVVSKASVLSHPSLFNPHLSHVWELEAETGATGKPEDRSFVLFTQKAHLIDG